MTQLLARLACALSLWLTAFQLTLWAADEPSFTRTPSTATRAAIPPVRGVHSIELPHFESPLPVAPGQRDYMVVCLSCHSSTYVRMQPPFTERQWQDTVDKMGKVYGALVAPEQKKAIVTYLSSTHGLHTGLGATTGDEESELASAPLLAEASEPAPLLKFADAAGDQARERSRGEELFRQDCAGCHGAVGRGDGVIAPVLLRKPEDLGAIRFSLKLLSDVLWNGKPGTAMPSWRALPERDRAALAVFVQSLYRPTVTEPGSQAGLERGGHVFLQNCAPCHGTSGEGNGLAAVNLLPRPANFQLKQPNPDYLFHIVSDGIAGTGMPAWKDQLSEADRSALAQYVRSLFRRDVN